MRTGLAFVRCIARFAPWTPPRGKDFRQTVARSVRPRLAPLEGCVLVQFGVQGLGCGRRLDVPLQDFALRDVAAIEIAVVIPIRTQSGALERYACEHASRAG